MTIVHGLVGVGPGWPAMRTKSNANIAVRAPEKVIVAGMVVEPAYADLRISSNGRFTIELEPGAWFFRIQYGSYKVIRLLEVPVVTVADYEDLVELDPGSLAPLPPLTDAQDAAVAGLVDDEDSETYDALAQVFAPIPAPSPVTEPAGFGWLTSPVHGKVVRNADGRSFSTTYDITTEKVTGGITRYVDVVAGSNAADGLTAGTAYQTLVYAMTKVNPGDTLMVKAGTYTRLQACTTIAKNLNIIGYGGPVLLSCHDALTWTLKSGATYTYQATRSAVGQVADVASGIPGKRYVKAASIAQVETLPGSWFADATTVYVHTIDNRAADTNIWALLTVPNLLITSDITVYIEGVTILGGSAPIDFRAPVAGVGPKLFLNKVLTGYGTLFDNVRSLGAQLSVAVNCDTFHGQWDGFGYHIFNGVIPKAVEINCRGFNNGGGSNSDNGSTAHDGASVIRINGAYWGNRGANVIDVGTGTQSWNLGVYAHDSALNDDFAFLSGAPIAWLDSCTARGSISSIYQADAATVNVRNPVVERINGAVAAY